MKSARQEIEMAPLPGAPANGRDASARREALVRRALAALDTTPRSIAASAGIDPRDVPLLLAGVGDLEAAVRLARALERASAELEELARELSAAARESED